MTIIYNFAEYVTSFIECYILVCAYSMFFKERFSKGIHTLGGIICSVIVMLLTLWMNSIDFFSINTVGVWTIAISIVAAFLYRANLFKALCVAIIYVVLLGAFDFFCLAVLELLFGAKGITLTVISSRGLLRTIYILSVKAVLVLVYLFAKRGRKRYEFRFFTGVLLCIYGCIFFWALQSMVNAIVTESIADMRRSVLFSLVFVILFVVGALVMLRISNRLKNERLENSIIMTRIKTLENDNRQLNDAYREIAKISHDHNNQIHTMAVLLRNKKYDELYAYLSEINADIQNVRIKPYTFIDSIDAVINSKVYQASTNNITMNVSASYPNSVHVRHVDICALLVNLLDNAIEACEKVEPPSSKYINLSISSIGEMIIVKVENSYNHALGIEGKSGELQTTKREAELHGYGIKIMRAITDKYNGTLEIEYDTNRFWAVAMLANSD